MWPREQIEISIFDEYFNEKRTRDDIHTILETPHSTAYKFYCTEKTRRDSSLDMSVDLQETDVNEDNSDLESEDEVFGEEFIASADSWFVYSFYFFY